MTDPRSWMRSTGTQKRESDQTSSAPGLPEPTRTCKQATVTMHRPVIFQNTLLAQPFPHQRTGYKTAEDPCNRTDKHNGGDFFAFESTYGRQYAPFTERPAVFTKDGIPLSATRVPGKPLMAVQLPPAGSLQDWRAIRNRNCYSHQWVLGSRTGKRCTASSTSSSSSSSARKAPPQDGAASTRTCGSTQAAAAQVQGARSSGKAAVKQMSSMQTTSQLAFRPVSLHLAQSVQMRKTLAADLTRDARKRLGVS